MRLGGSLAKLQSVLVRCAVLLRLLPVWRAVLLRLLQRSIIPAVAGLAPVITLAAFTTYFNYVSLRCIDVKDWFRLWLQFILTLIIFHASNILHHYLIQKHNHQNIQLHHQNIQMRTHKLMFKKILVKMVVSMPIHIQEVPDIELPDIPPDTNLSKISGSNDSAPLTYQHLNHILIIQKKLQPILIHPRNIWWPFWKLLLP